VGISSISAVIFGKIPLTSSKGAAMWAIIAGASSQAAIEHGFDSASSNKSASIYGKLYQSEAKGAVIEGYTPYENYWPMVAVYDA
jgi:hypothetical protein